jgi:hypothetical protein
MLVFALIVDAFAPFNNKISLLSNTDTYYSAVF